MPFFVDVYHIFILSLFFDLPCLALMDWFFFLIWKTYNYKNHTYVWFSLSISKAHQCLCLPSITSKSQLPSCPFTCHWFLPLNLNSRLSWIQCVCLSLCVSVCLCVCLLGLIIMDFSTLLSILTSQEFVAPPWIHFFSCSCTQLRGSLCSTFWCLRIALFHTQT